MLGRTNALCDVTFVVPDNYGGKNSAPGYLDNFYKRFSEIKGQQFDGVIVTGAPIEHLPFEEVKYWGELQAFLDGVKAMDAGMLSLCWGAMAFRAAAAGAREPGDGVCVCGVGRAWGAPCLIHCCQRLENCGVAA